MDTHLFYMSKIKVLPFLLLFVILGKYVSALTLKTEDVVIISKEDESIILNCTYQKNSEDEIIPDKDIRWKIRVENVFTDVAIFSPPGGYKPFISPDIKDLENRTELIAPSNSQLSAVMIIKNPVCTDEGIYQCSIQYTVGMSDTRHVENATTFVQFNGTAEAREPIGFWVHPNQLEENQAIYLICNADVGRPRGNIQIWKNFQNTITSELIYQSTFTNITTGNCMEYVNVTVLVTRKDNGALFRCSSQNNFTQDPGPSREWPKITVIYGPDKPAITLEPPKTMYSIGDPLTIRCKTASNPPPVFTWTFRPYNKTEEKPIEDNDKDTNLLVFESVQTKDAGTYTCTAINTDRPTSPNKTTSVSVHINTSERTYSGCNQCGYVETCQQRNEKEVCVFNTWLPVALAFILVCTTFAVSTIVLIIQRKRTREGTATNNILIESRCPQADATPKKIHGDYISPEDLEFGSLQPSVPQNGNSDSYTLL